MYLQRDFNAKDLILLRVCDVQIYHSTVKNTKWLEICITFYVFVQRIIPFFNNFFLLWPKNNKKN